MNFNICIEDQHGEQLQKATEVTGKSQNALICEALRKWFEQNPMTQWPEVILHHKSIGDVQPFENHRNELQLSVDDPLL